jgi:hypothetical protein
MFANQDDHFAARHFHGADPLIGVQCRGIKNGRVFAPAPPFHSVERVHAKVDEKRPLQPHPFRLPRTGQNLRRLFHDDGVGIAVGNYLGGGIGN